MLNLAGLFAGVITCGQKPVILEGLDIVFRDFRPGRISGARPEQLHQRLVGGAGRVRAVVAILLGRVDILLHQRRDDRYDARTVGGQCQRIHGTAGECLICIAVARAGEINLHPVILAAMLRVGQGELAILVCSADQFAARAVRPHAVNLTADNPATGNSDHIRQRERRRGGRGRISRRDRPAAAAAATTATGGKTNAKQCPDDARARTFGTFL